MKKILVTIIILIAFGLLFWGGSATSSKKVVSSENGAAAVSSLIASETFFDFGAISMKNGKVSRLFAVKNASTEPIMVKTVTTSCMCTEAFIVSDDRRRGPFGMPGHGFVPPVNERVPAGGTLGIDVVFDPAAHGPAGVGRIERAVFIEDESGGVQTITIKALVTP